MATTTNFDGWLDNVDTSDIEDVHSLYEAVNTKSYMGGFTVSEKETKLFIKDESTGETLMLVSEESIKSFLNILDYRFGGDFNSVHSQRDFARAMQKKD